MATQFDRFGNPIMRSIDDLQSIFYSEWVNKLGSATSTIGNLTKEAFWAALIAMWGDYGLNFLPSIGYTQGSSPNLTEIGLFTEYEIFGRLSLIYDKYTNLLKAFDKDYSVIESLSASSEESSSDKTTYGSNETNYDLPNSAVSKPYGNPSDYSEQGGSDGTERSVTRTTKAELNPVEQRELFYRTYRNIIADFMNEFEPCFCVLSY